MMILIGCMLAVYLQTVYGRTPSHQEPVEVENAVGDKFHANILNDLIENLLKNVMEKRGHEIDPNPMPDLEITFKKRIFLITYTGSAHLYDGVVRGLSSLHRDGDSSITTDHRGLQAYVNLSVVNLEFDYKGTVAFMGVGPEVDVHGTVERLSINMTLTADPGKTARLKRFWVRKIEGVDVKIKRLGILESFVNSIAGPIVNAFKPTVAHVIERKFNSMIDDILMKLDLRLGR